MDLLAETGREEAVSVRAVADRVGVSVPSIYLHFADKQALLDAVCAQVFTDLDVAMQQASVDARDPIEALERQGVAYVRFALEHPEQYRIVMMRPPPEAGSDFDDPTSMATFTHFLETVDACVQVGVLQGEPLELGLQLWAAAHGLASLLIAKPTFPWPPLEEFIQRTIRASGIGVAAVTRLPVRPDLPELTRRLDSLSGP